MPIKVPNYIEIVCQTEYQDIYRIRPSVLLVVDKFSAYDEDGNCIGSCNGYPIKTVPYHPKAEKYLRVKKGTSKVIYCGSIVRKVNPDKYNYKLKTSGDAFSGNIYEFNRLLLNVKEIMKCYSKELFS